ARRFDASGNPLGGEFQINTSGGKQENPSLGVASDGSFTVVWDDKTGLDVIGREYDASDNPLAGEFIVNTTTAGEQSKPDIGMNADGDFVTVWEHKDTKDIFGFRGKPPLFTDVSGSVGFDVQSSDAVTSGAGLHWADYDNDGDLDAIVTGNNSARLYLSTNEGDSFFVTNFGGGNYPRQGAMLDIDNDGDIDFWHSGETFHENNGSASFTVAGDLGFSNPVATESTAAADVNGDGYCDVLMFSSNGNWIGTHQGRVVETLVGTNNTSDGLNDAGDYGSGGYCSSGDVNNDGFLDFFYHYGTGKLFLSNTATAPTPRTRAGSPCPPAAPRRSAAPGATTTTTGTWICSCRASPPARAAICGATTAARSWMSPSRRASPIRPAIGAAAGATTTTTGIWISTSVCPRGPTCSTRIRGMGPSRW
ncbi:MAG: VCBS repeat-containing protein, partial [Planctomycetes bacterium]|nr:VCBS repeat-containing protein [Planctomycetota bacterium]